MRSFRVDHDTAAYEAYVARSEKLGLPVMSREKWDLVTRGIPSNQGVPYLQSRGDRPRAVRQ